MWVKHYFNCKSPRGNKNPLNAQLKAASFTNDIITPPPSLWLTREVAGDELPNCRWPLIDPLLWLSPRVSGLIAASGVRGLQPLCTGCMKHMHIIYYWIPFQETWGLPGYNFQFSSLLNFVNLLFFEEKMMKADFPCWPVVTAKVRAWISSLI